MRNLWSGPIHLLASALPSPLSREVQKCVHSERRADADVGLPQRKPHLFGIDRPSFESRPRLHRPRHEARCRRAALHQVEKARLSEII